MEKALRRYLARAQFDGVSQARSRNMAAIRASGNLSTERRLRAALAQAGIAGWKLAASLPGRPDFYFPKQKVVVFVDGCFWHGCRKCGHVPKTRARFWETKLARNKERDRENVRQLRQAGFTVLRFWEHDLRSRLADCLEKVRHTIS